MADLSAVVKQLKKERDQAEKLVKNLDEALRLLIHLGAKASTHRRRRRLSLAARKKIAAAQRARWAKARKDKTG